MVVKYTIAAGYLETGRVSIDNLEAYLAPHCLLFTRVFNRLGADLALSTEGHAGGRSEAPTLCTRLYLADHVKKLSALILTA